jgi:predicted nucleic acid-binding protein
LASSSCAAKARSRSASTLNIDLDGALRATRAQRPTIPLTRRPDAQLPWASREALIGAPLMLDTTVYLDVLSGRTPAKIDELLRFRICNHSAVCLAELTHAFGRLDPRHPNTKSVLKILRDVISDVPAHRLYAADSDAWAAAGMLAGALSRHTGLGVGQGRERRFLNDALLFLQARKLGCAVLSGNIRDFDLLNQLMPSGRIILYRKTSAP